MLKLMNSTLAFALLALFVTACAAPATPGATVPQVQTVRPPDAPKAGSVAINGAGATFPFPLYSRWFYDYAFVDTAVKFNYQSIGSGAALHKSPPRRLILARVILS
jgi:ABC-type phosphate transport system substrate-binding protein